MSEKVSDFHARAHFFFHMTPCYLVSKKVSDFYAHVYFFRHTFFVIHHAWYLMSEKKERLSCSWRYLVSNKWATYTLTFSLFDAVLFSERESERFSCSCSLFSPYNTLLSGGQNEHGRYNSGSKYWKNYFSSLCSSVTLSAKEGLSDFRLADTSMTHIFKSAKMFLVTAFMTRCIFNVPWQIVINQVDRIRYIYVCALNTW